MRARDGRRTRVHDAEARHTVRSALLHPCALHGRRAEPIPFAPVGKSCDYCVEGMAGRRMSRRCEPARAGRPCGGCRWESFHRETAGHRLADAGLRYGRDLLAAPAPARIHRAPLEPQWPEDRATLAGTEKPVLPGRGTRMDAEPSGAGLSHHFQDHSTVASADTAGVPQQVQPLTEESSQAHAENEEGRSGGEAPQPGGRCPSRRVLRVVHLRLSDGWRGHGKASVPHLHARRATTAGSTPVCTAPRRRVPPRRRRDRRQRPAAVPRSAAPAEAAPAG